MRALFLIPIVMLALSSPATAATTATECVWTSTLTNPRLPLGRLRALPSGVACPPAFVAPVQRPAPLAPTPEPAPTVIVVHELRIRPSEVIIEPPQVHFVDRPADAPPTPDPTP